MNQRPIAEAVTSRLKADTGAGGLYNGNAWQYVNRMAHLSSDATSDSTPYGYFTVALRNDEPSMGGVGGTYDLNFVIIDLLASGSATIEDVFERLFGNSMLASGTNSTPTYGLHNHNLVLPSNGLSMQGGQLFFVDSEIIPSPSNPERIEGLMSFRGVWSVSAVNPNT